MHLIIFKINNKNSKIKLHQNKFYKKLNKWLIIINKTLKVNNYSFRI